MSFWSALGQVASRNHSLHHDFSLRGRVQGAREGTANNQQAGCLARRRRRRSRPRAAPPEGCEVEEETAEKQWRRRPPRRLGRRLGVRFGTLPACRCWVPRVHDRGLDPSEQRTRQVRVNIGPFQMLDASSTPAFLSHVHKAFRRRRDLVNKHFELPTGYNGYSFTPRFPRKCR